jgi:hypothetical protein
MPLNQTLNHRLRMLHQHKVVLLIVNVSFYKIDMLLEVFASDQRIDPIKLLKLLSLMLQLNHPPILRKPFQRIPFAQVTMLRLTKFANTTLFPHFKFIIIRVLPYQFPKKIDFISLNNIMNTN